MKNLLLVERYETKSEKGPWLAVVPRLVGCHSYGATENEAIQKTLMHAHRFIASKIERGTLTVEEALDLTFRLATSEEHKGAFAHISREESLGWKGEPEKDI
jgi:hypothetical protein